MGEVVIRAEHLSKYYKLGVINNGTLFRDLQTWWALKRGKQDPHSQIGSHKYDNDKDGFWALDDLNFEIEKGDRVGIIGKNGAGKSTLLKVLSRITAPTAGDVKIRGRVASLLEVGTGFHAELTGRENIYLNGAILGMKKKEVDRKIDEIIALSEIEKHIDTPVKRYSSGMYVRLAFAVAAHLDSEILIADEVLAVGDAAFQKKALGKMNDLSTGEGRTVLFVSHNMSQVNTLCQKGLVLDHGHIQYTGDIKSAMEKYLIQGADSNTILSSRTFEEDEKYNFQLLSVEMLDKNNQPASTFEAQTEIKVHFKCISRKPIPELYGYYLFRDEVGNPLIIFDSQEENDILNNLPTGIHEYTLTIPKGVFGGNKTYTLYTNFTSRNNDNGFNAFSPDNICSFKIVDSLSERGKNREAMTSIIPHSELHY